MLVSPRRSGAPITASVPVTRPPAGGPHDHRLGSDNAPYRNLFPGVAPVALPPSPTPAMVTAYPVIDVQPLVEAIIRRGDSPHTRRAYGLDLATYAAWLASDGLIWYAVTPDDLDRYGEWLAGMYARTTANRRLVVVRALYGEAKRRHLVTDDPSDRLRNVRGRDDRDGGALTRQQAHEVLEAICGDLAYRARYLLATRDLALVSLLLRTGIRRSELTSLRVASLGSAQGHHVLTITGKGNVVRTVKVPPDVWRMLETWLEAATQAGVELAGDDPLFVEVRKGGHIPGRHPLSDRAIYAIVVRRLQAADVLTLGPHGLRATFVTLALEGGAPLHLVQRAAGHADPRTTERYWKRKDGLDDNAVDYVKL
jgi:integrase/recombinase XerD